MFQTMVLALDGSRSSERALEVAGELARTHGSTVHVVHVIEIVAGRGGGGPARLDEDELRAAVERQVEGLTESGLNAKLEVHAVMAGGPAHVIAGVAERAGADVIVTGTRGHTALAGIFVGSVAQRLLHLAHCPVVVVPDPEQRRGAVARQASTGGR